MNEKTTEIIVALLGPYRNSKTGKIYEGKYICEIEDHPDKEMIGRKAMLSEPEEGWEEVKERRYGIKKEDIVGWLCDKDKNPI